MNPKEWCALKLLTSQQRGTLLALALSLPGNSLAANESFPLTISDRQAIIDARERVRPWFIVGPLEGRPTKVLAFLFDGTRNDKDNVPSPDHQTVIGHMDDVLRAGGELAREPRYYKGAGTTGPSWLKAIDAAKGFSTARTARKACTEALEQIASLRSETPDADIRILVAGFSRGAASARHFMNLVERGCRAAAPPADPHVRFYAVLFDTVATGQRGNVLLGIPESADSVIHFTSLDERRIAFGLDYDASADDERVQTVPVPGVHSDVGDSYDEGVGGVFRAHVDLLLSQMGLSHSLVVNVPIDYALEGGNDSRWLVDRHLGVLPSRMERARDRRKFPIESRPLSGERLAELRWRRLHINGDGSNARMDWQQVAHVTPGFNVAVSSAGLTLTPYDVKHPRLRLSPQFGNGRVFRCKAADYLSFEVDGGATHLYLLPRAVSERIATGDKHQLEIGVVARKGGTQLWWIVDDKIVGKIEAGGPIAGRLREETLCDDVARARRVY